MKLGSPATGADFVGRAQELTDIWQYLEADHLKFPGVRRLGKTSILKRLLEESPEHGVLAQWIDVSKVDSAQKFVALLSQSFPEGSIAQFVEQSSQRVSAWMQRLKKMDMKLPDALGGGGVGIELQTGQSTSWLADAQKLQTRLQAQPLLMLLDEFPVMLNALIARDPKEAEALLIWLRIWRQSPGSCRFLFTGSIGLQSLLERHGLDLHMNDCLECHLGAFKPNEARTLWQTFAQQGGWQSAAEVTEYALIRVGWLSPYLLCLLLDESMKAARDREQETGSPPATPAIGGQIQSADVDSAYENLLAARSRFHHWERRLKDSLAEPDLGFCLALLTLLSRKSDGLSLRQLNNRLSKRQPDAEQRARLVQDLLARLVDEGYTSPPDVRGRVQFLSFLLRDWWSRNHV